MKRRAFLKTCAVGVTVGPTSLAFLPTAQDQTEKGEGNIDPGKLSELAYQHFIPNKRTCCEAILMAGCEALGIQSDLVPDIGLGLAGGIGLQGKTCGVLSGCAMVISLAIAQKEKEYSKKKMPTFQAAGRIVSAFEEQAGNTECRALCGLDLTTAEGRKKLEGGVKEQTCAKLVKLGSELLVKELQKL